MPTMPQVTDRVKDAPAAVLRAVFAGVGQLLLAAEKLRARVMEEAPAEPPRTAPMPQPQPAEDTGNVRVLREEPGAVNEAAEPAPPGRTAPEPSPQPSPEPAPAPAAEQATAKESAPARKPRATRKPATPKPAPEAAPERAGDGKPAGRRTAATARKSAEPGRKPAARKPAGAEAAPAAIQQGQAAPAVEATAPAAAVTAGGAPIANYEELSIASLRARLRVFDAATVQALLEYERAHAARADVMTMFERRLAKLEGAAG